MHLGTRQTLIAEVKVAKIDRLEIFSRFRQINNGDKQHIEVRAYDDEGNQFSSLEGFKFEWTVLGGHENVIRISPEAAQHTKTHAHAYETWLHDDDFFLKARQKGHTQLQVEIKEPSYEQVKAATINLTIVEPFVIKPEQEEYGVVTPYILPNSEFRFKLQYLSLVEGNGVRFTDISIPSPIFKWSLVLIGKQNFG